MPLFKYCPWHGTALSRIRTKEQTNKQTNSQALQQPYHAPLTYHHHIIHRPTCMRGMPLHAHHNLIHSFFLEVTRRMQPLHIERSKNQYFFFPFAAISNHRIHSQPTLVTCNRIPTTHNLLPLLLYLKVSSSRIIGFALSHKQSPSYNINSSSTSAHQLVAF